MTPSHREDPQSQLPAIELLVNLGWEYLTPEEVTSLRGPRGRNVLLEPILRKSLKRINRFTYKGRTHEFNDAGVEEAIDALSAVQDDGLLPVNRRIYDLLCLGKSVGQTVEGSALNPQLRYLDFDPATLANTNVYHVTEEFRVPWQSDDTEEKRHRKDKSRRPDLVLFVNGIPLVVIECKAPGVKDGIDLAIRQQRGNQKPGEIPHLFRYAQLLLAVNQQGGRYGTVGTPREFWSEWKEDWPGTKTLEELVNRPLPRSVAEAIESVKNTVTRHEVIVARETDGRAVTGQDRLLHAVCRPERVLELMRQFTVYDAGKKKVARYQQYFAIRKLLGRVGEIDPEGRRDGGRRHGGVIWHTQGSGKSLTMVMFAKNLALSGVVPNPRILVVTDRIDLDKQIRDTFADCGVDEVERARTGKHLRQLITKKADVVTTIIDKFEGALHDEVALDEDRDIFVLVDESHRSQFGAMHALMRKALPNACYIGFTGTPLRKGEKDTARQFGGIQDTYTIDQAVEDGAVRRLLYEGRLVEQEVDRRQIDAWFDRLTEGRSREERAELKRQFADAGHLHKAEQRMRCVAADISAHYADRFQGTGLKGQLVADSRHSAIRYHQLLKEIGLVSSEVIISPSAERDEDDNEDQKELTEAEVTIEAFWKQMMHEHGSEENYLETVISRFKGEGDPEIIIVCSKLLTGFDAPRNTVLYLDRMLREHTLLQAIARVNRNFAEETTDGRATRKEFGYIVDYRGILGELDQALSTYSELAGFEAEDIDGALLNIESEIATLDAKHRDLTRLFQRVRNRQDLEAFVDILRDEAIRDEFVDRLSQFGRTFEIALTSFDWIRRIEPKMLKLYREDLKFFENLRRIARGRFADEVDYREYEAQMQKLIDQHVGSEGVEPLTELVDIFDQEQFEAEVARSDSAAARADTIAHRTARTITARMDEDPVFFQRLSRILRKAIEDYEAKRIRAAEYLRTAEDARDQVRQHGVDNVPLRLRDNRSALAVYHTLTRALLGEDREPNDEEEAGFTILAIKLDRIVETTVVVDWQNKPDVQNGLKNALEDTMIDAFRQEDREVDLSVIDFILDKVIQSARHHYPG